MLKACVEKILSGGALTKSEALEALEQPLETLCSAADAVRSHFLGNRFDFCTIVNVKNGGCSEDCKFCAQSSKSGTAAQKLSETEIIEDAKRVALKGIRRYSLVASGKKLSPDEVSTMCRTIERLSRETDLTLCASFGLLSTSEYERLKEAGLKRVHNNLETSARFFNKICSTHGYCDKIKAIEAAKSAGLEVCSGILIGMGETEEDRIDVAFDLKKLRVDSVPINVLNPIPGTPFEQVKPLGTEAILRTVALYRLILPTLPIRLAGGRILMADRGRACFKSGANAAITGDMLTTAGITVADDFACVKGLDYSF